MLLRSSPRFAVALLVLGLSGASLAQEVPRATLATLPQPLGATLALPQGATLTSAFELVDDEDGLKRQAPYATVNGVGAALKLSTGAELGWVPTSAEADLADNSSRSAPFEVHAQRKGAGGAWAVVYAWDSASCYLHGWAPEAKVFCNAVDLKVPCADAVRMAELCVTLQPAPVAAAGPTDPALSFPKVSDAKAAAAAAATARAIARNDREALLRLVSPKGLRLGKRRLEGKALTTALSARTVQQVLGLSCAASPGGRGSSCLWNTESDGADGVLRVASHTGYGKVPTLVLARANDGAWWFTGVEIDDLGEP